MEPSEDSEYADMSDPASGREGVPIPNPTVSDHSHVTGITMDFTQVTPELTAMHGYITIHYADGAVETLGGHARNESLNPHSAIEKTDLVFKVNADIRDPRDVAASFGMRAPRGESLDSYARAIKDGADAYNRHPFRYSPVGEDGFNSTSLSSSLLVAKGGETARNDLNFAASNLSMPHLRLANVAGVTPQDASYSAKIDVATASGHPISTGIDHAGISAAEFRHGAGQSQHEHGTASVDDLLGRDSIGADLAWLKAKFGGGPVTDLPHHIDTLSIRENGSIVARPVSSFGPQTGTVSYRDGDDISLSVGGSRSPLHLSRTELIAGSKNPEATAIALEQGHRVTLTFRDGDVGVQDHGLARGLTQQHELTHQRDLHR